MESVKWYPKTFARKNEGILYERVPKSVKTRLYSNCVIIGERVIKITKK